MPSSILLDLSKFCFSKYTPFFQPGKKVLIRMSTTGTTQGQENQTSLQIYESKAGVSPFWIEKYERDARRNWDIFYKRHQAKFFKDRHYLDKEWGSYFSGGKKVVLEVGCGAGNTIFPLLASFPDIFVHACDFSPRAIDLVKAHKDYDLSLVNAFVCDLTADDLVHELSPSSVDVVTMIFVLSAVTPEKMSLILQNIKRVLKPNGYVLLRDYATGDLAQERFNHKDQKIFENFYVRGDGTRAFYFSEEYLSDLFQSNGFQVDHVGLYCKQIENRSREIVMNRRWIQGVFQNNDSLDISEGFAAELFGGLPTEEVMTVNIEDCEYQIKALSKEHQHTCKSTGLMIWESARLMSSILLRNSEIVRGKSVLELGSGGGGICAMSAARSARLVVATDGDPSAVRLLSSNISSNSSLFDGSLVTRELQWGNREHVAALKDEYPDGFDVVLGTDVTYIPDAIGSLFDTARELISRKGGGDVACFVLCHVLRRVDEGSLVLAASRCGFRLANRWPDASTYSYGCVSPWLPFFDHESVPSTALTIICFHLES